MPDKIPLIVVGGQIRQMQAGDTISPTIAPGSGGSFVFSLVEKDLGVLPRYGGAFDITGLSGLTAGKPVMVTQRAGPYTGKGDREDEAEMDSLTVTGFVVDATTVRCYWNVPSRNGPVVGNIKFQYLISA